MRKEATFAIAAGEVRMKNKIVLLMPMLMLDNNRKANNDALDYALKHYTVDMIAINDQEFKDYDYREDSRIQYIGRHKERRGFVNGRNDLLRWFYNSDYDWAVWLDGNAKITKTSINDFVTVTEAIKAGEVEVDVILSTLGIYISSTRIDARRAKDHLENVKLTRVKDTENAWMHGMFMKNFKKAYGMEVYIDEACDPRAGLSEDVYFVQLCKKLFSVRQCPTITVTKPPNKASTWVAGAQRYAYPPIDWKGIAKMVKMAKHTAPEEKNLKGTYIYKRSEYMKEEVTAYKERSRKKVSGGLLRNVVKEVSE